MFKFLLQVRPERTELVSSHIRHFGGLSAIFLIVCNKVTYLETPRISGLKGHGILDSRADRLCCRTSSELFRLSSVHLDPTRICLFRALLMPVCTPYTPRTRSDAVPNVRFSQTLPPHLASWKRCLIPLAQSWTHSGRQLCCAPANNPTGYSPDGCEDHSGPERTRGPCCSQDVVCLVPTPSLLTTPPDTRMLDCQGHSGVHGDFLAATDSNIWGGACPGEHH